MPREAWVLVKAMVSDTYPDQGLPGPQPPFPGQPPLGIWGPTDPRPTHPIAGWNPGTGTWPQPPLGIWGPTDPRPTPPIYIPITPPPDSGLSPEHPIYIPVYPDNTLPGPQPRPDHGYLPYPDNTLPGQGGGGGQAALIAKIKKVVDFWTGNLPTPPGEKPTPV